MRISDWSSDVCSSDLHARQKGYGSVLGGRDIGRRHIARHGVDVYVQRYAVVGGVGFTRAVNQARHMACTIPIAVAVLILGVTRDLDPVQIATAVFFSHDDDRRETAH